jgi:hypothetical protein
MDFVQLQSNFFPAKFFFFVYFGKGNFGGKKITFKEDYSIKDPVQHKSLIDQKATECRSYDQPKIRRKPVFGQFALSRSSTDFRLVVRSTFGSLLTDYFFVLYGIIW